MRVSLLTPLAAAALLLAACQPESSPPPAATTAMPDVQTEVSLPVSLNEVMVALVNHAADPIWAATWNNPESDRDWRELERLAYQIQIGGALMQYPGTGPLDAQWVADERWMEWSSQMSRDGQRAVNALRSRDMDLIFDAGSRLVETCEACHTAFRPDIPTMGMFGELSQLPPVSLPGDE